MSDMANTRLRPAFLSTPHLYTFAMKPLLACLTAQHQQPVIEATTSEKQSRAGTKLRLGSFCALKPVALLNSTRIPHRRPSRTTPSQAPKLRQAHTYRQNRRGGSSSSIILIRRSSTSRTGMSRFSRRSDFRYCTSIGMSGRCHACHAQAHTTTRERGVRSSRSNLVGFYKQIGCFGWG